MRIAIQAADLDAERIDGTRVYLSELLKRFGELAPRVCFSIYHRDTFHPALAPPDFSNYSVIKVPGRWLWMQTRFVWEIFRRKEGFLFFPVQAVPWLLPRNAKVVVTVHDLAFRYFPETFPFFDRVKLRILLFLAVRRADILLSVSESTKKDLLHFFPTLSSEKIRVVHHGYSGRYDKKVSQEQKESVCARYGVDPEKFILFVGAIQPRKNLTRLIRVFGRIREKYPDLKLLCVGERAWLSDSIFAEADRSVFREDILFPGKALFEDLPALYQSARAFVFPSLYEGFGIPVLEAFASGVPVLTGDNSSLREVASDAALLCDVSDEQDMAKKLEQILSDGVLREKLVRRGTDWVKNFSWDKTAQETLSVLLGQSLDNEKKISKN